jgi:hypothetical protein
MNFNSNYLNEELTEQTIIKIINDYPNDSELGAFIRKFYGVNPNSCNVDNNEDCLSCGS